MRNLVKAFVISLDLASFQSREISREISRDFARNFSRIFVRFLLANQRERKAKVEIRTRLCKVYSVTSSEHGEGGGSGRSNIVELVVLAIDFVA